MAHHHLRATSARLLSQNVMMTWQIASDLRSEWIVPNRIRYRQCKRSRLVEPTGLTPIACNVVWDIAVDGSTFLDSAPDSATSGPWCVQALAEMLHK